MVAGQLDDSHKILFRLGRIEFRNLHKLLVTDSSEAELTLDGLSVVVVVVVISAVQFFALH